MTDILIAGFGISLLLGIAVCAYYSRRVRRVGYEPRKGTILGTSRLTDRIGIDR